MDAPTIFPPITFRLEAWCQRWIKIYPIIDPGNNRIFLFALVRFRKFSFCMIQKEEITEDGVKLL
jgi:hypothetical protein